MTSSAEVRELLARIWLFSELKEPELAALAQIAQRRRVEAKKVVVHQGGTDADLYGVIRGHLKVSACNREGHEIVLNLMQVGEVFGEIALLDGKARSATVTALSACELVVIRRSDFLVMLGHSPAVASALLTALAKLVRSLSERAEDSAFLDVRTRLAKRLVALAEDYGTPLGPHQVALKIRLSQQELGDMVEATRESVNKCLRAWMRDGIIQRSGRHLVIDDSRRLKELAAR